MLCDDCKKKQASVNFTQIIGNKKTLLKLCQECSEKRGFSSHGVAAGAAASGFGVGNLISKMATEYEEEKDAVACPRCKLKYVEFKQTGRLGCGACYSIFGKRLDDLLRKIHGSDYHIGKVPKNIEPAIEQSRHMEALRKELKDAILRENFEKAAKLRDKIKRMDVSHD
jgi:protein arginine kinase activator